MSNIDFTDSSTATSSSTTVPSTSHRPPEAEDAITKALRGLTQILPSPPPASLSAFSLLHDPAISSSITSLLHHPTSGSGDNPLCRCLYDTFQSGDTTLQLSPLSYIPLMTTLYLKRVSSTRHHTSGFEAVLLSLYSHEIATRPIRTPLSVTIPKLSSPSVYHHPLTPSTAASTELHVGIQSQALEPHSTLRATSRARVIGVALEVYYSCIESMPLRSKVDFCESCQGWGCEMGGLPWELMQPVLRILGHCLMVESDGDLHGKARRACMSFYKRALNGIDSKTILATRSLIRMIDVDINEFDYTEVPLNRVISI